MKRVIPFLVLLILLIHCNPDEEKKECVISECQGWAYAIVDWDTNENLVGYDRMFNPDDVKIMDEDMNEIWFKAGYLDWVDWWEFSFDYHDLVKRCDLHNTDSTFTIRILIQLNESDIDTLDTRIAPCRDFDEVYYNGSKRVYAPKGPVGKDQLNPSDLSSFHLRKKLN